MNNLCRKTVNNFSNNTEQKIILCRKKWTIFIRKQWTWCSTNYGISSFLKTRHQPAVVAPTVVIRTTCANRRHYFTRAAQQLGTISHIVQSYHPHSREYLNIWIIIPWCQGHNIVSIKYDALFKNTATTAHIFKSHCDIGNI